MDCNATIEEGEISDESYELNSRPNEDNFKTKQLQDSDDESDNDNEMMKVKRPVERNAQQSKSGNLWREMLQEEDLMENLKTCDVSTNTRKRKLEVNRGVETYDVDIETVENKKRKEFSDEPRLIKKLDKNKKVKEILIPRVLPDLSTENFTDEEYATNLSAGLQEKNVELITKVVSTIGKENAQKIYDKTKEMEKKGGMLTLNKMRRRTSGGIFLFLLKSSNELDEIQRKDIFGFKKEKDNNDELVMKS